MEQDPTDKKVVKIKVTDKRGVAETSPTDHAETLDTKDVSNISAKSPAGDVSAPSAPTGDTEAQEVGASGAPEPENEFLDDLRRLQADFDNYRKRMMRESAEASDRATGRVIEELLPVIDNFERAIAHGEGGEGVQLVFKDLKSALERLGLEEIPAEGAVFDPNVHEAMELRETEGLEEPTVIEVYRRGYILKDRLVRAASVVVGRPTESE